MGISNLKLSAESSSPCKGGCQKVILYVLSNKIIITKKKEKEAGARWFCEEKKEGNGGELYLSYGTSSSPIISMREHVVFPLSVDVISKRPCLL